MFTHYAKFDLGKKLEQFKQIETENLQIEKNNIEKKTETVLPPINYKNSASVGNVNPFTGKNIINQPFIIM